MKLNVDYKMYGFLDYHCPKCAAVVQETVASAMVDRKVMCSCGAVVRIEGSREKESLAARYSPSKAE